MKKKNIFLVSLIILCVSITSLFAQEDMFTRMDSILVPEIDNCGFGELIAGVDFDDDQKVEIYVVNNMNDIGGNELIPRIYKYEFNGTEWELVWDEFSRDIVQQNSWAALTYGDWDGDNKKEILWAPANNFIENNLNPPRIMIWEANGDDKLGKANFGFETPSAQWTITDQESFEVRPFRMIFNDIDDDGVEELIFGDRQLNYRFGVVSITDVPDNGNGSETWTMEASGLEDVLDDDPIYDMAIMNGTIYLFHSDGTVTPVKYENETYSVLDGIPDFLPGGSWKSSNSLDLNNDGKNEIVISGWQPNSSNVANKIFLIEEDEQNVIKKTMIANFGPLISATGRINGGHDAYGDIDNDGNIDFIFGSRQTEPSVAILRMEYLGGEISDSNSYEISVIDSLYPTENPGRYDIVSVANLDEDPELEVLYTNGASCERFPIVILDLNKPVGVNENFVPTQFSLEQNYPNPFNPVTNISFSLPEQSEVSLKIFNTLGEEMEVIVNREILSRGNYNFKFNSKNYSSGIYFYILESSSFGILTKKMILLK